MWTATAGDKWKIQEKRAEDKRAMEQEQHSEVHRGDEKARERGERRNGGEGGGETSSGGRMAFRQEGERLYYHRDTHTHNPLILLKSVFLLNIKDKIKTQVMSREVFSLKVNLARLRDVSHLNFLSSSGFLTGLVNCEDNNHIRGFFGLHVLTANTSVIKVFCVRTRSRPGGSRYIFTLRRSRPEGKTRVKGGVQPAIPCYPLISPA